MKIDGTCHCGAITYEAEVDPQEVFICHCTDCQTLSGTALRTVVAAAKDSFRILTGQPKIYVKKADSGRLREQSFCADCGTPIYATSSGDGPKIYNLRVGSIRQRNDLPPRSQYWTHSAQAWIATIGALPKVGSE